MAIAKDVEVNIQKVSQGVSNLGFGVALLVTTETTKAYKEYTGLNAVKVDYNEATKAYKMAAVLFAQVPKPKLVAIVGIEYTDTAAFIDSLSTMTAANNKWYYLLCDRASNTELITALNTFALSYEKVYVFQMLPTDFGSFVLPVSDRCVGMIHDKPAQYADVAFVGACSTYKAGEATWKFKSLVGIDPVEYTDQSSEVMVFTEAGLNTYVRKNGIAQTSEGLCTSGEYVDTVISIDWIELDQETRISTLLVSNPKIPYTNEGIALVAAQVDASLKTATQMGIIRKDESSNGLFTINIPDISEIEQEDIVSRKFDNYLSWTALMTSAIHHTEINGVVSY